MTSTLKTDTASSYETSVNTDQTIRYHFPTDRVSVADSKFRQMYKIVGSITDEVIGFFS
jgi:hypothetical protein